MTFPPGPPARTGNPLETLRYGRAFLADPLGFTRGRFEEHGDLYYAAAPGEHLYVTRHPDHFREILVTHAGSWRKQPEGPPKGLGLFLGNGLLTADGDDWRRHRRMIQPAFRPDVLGAYAPAMVEASREVGWSDGLQTDLASDLMRTTLRIVCRVLFDHDPTDETDQVARAMTALQDAAGTPDLLPDWLPSPQRWRARRAKRDLDAIVHGTIDERRALIARGDEPPRDLLTALLQAVDEDDGGGFSRDQLKDELLTLFLAGHETTALALTWTFVLLAQNPTALARVLAELPDRDPEADDELPYLDAVIRESLRLYPPAYATERYAAEDTEVGGFPVPKGAQAVLWFVHAHRDARWWPDPDAFRPDRFLEPDPERPKLAWVPFGAGQRMCVGAGFALLEARLVLATLLRSWHVTLAGPPPAPRPRVTLAPAGPVRAVVRRRA